MEAALLVEGFNLGGLGYLFLDAEKGLSLTLALGLTTPARRPKGGLVEGGAALCIDSSAG